MLLLLFLVFMGLLRVLCVSVRELIAERLSHKKSSDHCGMITTLWLFSYNDFIVLLRKRYYLAKRQSASG